MSVDTLSILKSEDDYRQFVQEDKKLQALADHPESFPALTSRNANYLGKLNYQFLELDGREKFLRYLNQGSILKKDEMSRIRKENELLSMQVENQRKAVDETKIDVGDRSEKLIKLLVKEVNRRSDAVRDLDMEIELLAKEHRLLTEELQGDDKSLDELVHEQKTLGADLGQLQVKFVQLCRQREEQARELDQKTRQHQELVAQREQIEKDIRKYDGEESDGQLRAKVHELNGLLGIWGGL